MNAPVDEEDREGMPPISTTTFGIPNDPELLDAYELYRPSMGTRRLVSEQHREIYPEAFIEHERLGTLADLCVRALAKNQGTVHIASLVREDPLKLRIHYDSIDVDLPLQECYFVEDLRYWRRVVLAKSSDKSLALKKLSEYDWRGKGISIKYVELVEACPAAFWPEHEMAHLAGLVREHVRTMDIRHLQSRTEESFQHQMDSSGSEPDITSEESEQLVISSDERNTSSDLLDEAEEECSEEQSAVEQQEEQEQQPKQKQEKQPQSKPKPKPKQAKINFNDLENDQEQSAAGEAEDGSYPVDGIHEDRREGRAARNAVRQQLRDMQAARREQHEQQKRRRSLMRKKPVEETLSKRRKSRKTVMGVFNMKVEPEKDDAEEKIVDKRNKEKLLGRIKRYDYPSEHCHHIDLSFVRFFDNLASLTLEFLGPHMGRDFHKRHLRFSLEDMLRLARGVQALDQLKIFRLRNSRMDRLKLHALCGGLKDLKALEVVDFGYDQISDDCGPTLGSLLQRENMLKALELEYNQLDLKAASAIGAALMQHQQNAGAMHLQYLGLADNRISDKALSTLIHYIVGTEHVEELNVSAITARKEAVADSLGYLLRNHPPLRRLDMAAIPMNTVGRRLICALERNHKVTHFDCRGCDMDSDEEFDASIIVRRNGFQRDHSYIGDETKTELDIQKHFKSIKHPLVQKLENERQRRAECVKVRPSLIRTPSEHSIKSVAEEKEEPPEYDIWAELGIKTKASVPVVEASVSSHSTVTDQSPFHFDPNSFDLEQFRQHIHHPGMGNRYYYFKSRRENR